MRRDLDRRLSDLERVAVPGDDTRSTPVAPELRAAICTNPDDAAAFERLLWGRVRLGEK